MSKKEDPIRKAAAIHIMADEDCDAVVRILDEALDPMAQVTLPPECVDMAIARLLYVRDMRLGLIPNTTVH